MASSDRVYRDSNDKVFVPMNVEGSNYADTFMTTPKVITIVSVAVSLAVLIFYMADNSLNVFQIMIWIVLWLLVVQIPIRYIVFDEKAYYKVYQEMKEIEITTPSQAWDIVSLSDSGDGVVMTYAGNRVGVLLKVEKDTIVGKPSEFEEQHKDAVSNFYNELVTNKYSCVYMDTMESTGKDKRLSELDKLTLDRSNKNSLKIVQYEVGYIKKITQKTLTENDYFLIYSNDITRSDRIIQDTIEAALILMDGAYSDFEICGINEITNIEKELTGVSMFNINEASLEIFNKNARAEFQEVFDIDSLEWANGEKQKLTNLEKNKINNIINMAHKTQRNIKNYTVQKEVYREDKNKFKVDFNDLGKVNGRNTSNNKNDEYIDL